MAFDDDLRAYLEALERHSSLRIVDETELRHHLLTRLREPAHHAPWVKHVHATWMPRLSAFARYIERLPLHVAPTTAADADNFAAQVLDAALGILPPMMNLVDRLERERVAAEFRSPSSDIDAYALETRLTRRSSAGAPLDVTQLGRAFLRLRGKDGVRWLLTLEVLQNRGDDDRWRISRGMLETAMSAAGIGQWLTMEGELAFVFSDAMIQHAVHLGVLEEWRTQHELETTGYVVESSMGDVVGAVLTPGPWHAAIAAMLEDERTTVVAGAIPSASDAVLEQSRMITHEVRNALGPARHHLDLLLAQALGRDAQKRVAKARLGVVRLLEFVDQMVLTAEVVEDPPVALDLEDVAREAAKRIDDGEHIEIVSPPNPISVRAPRAPLVIVLSNLLRNALQTQQPLPRVRLSMHSTDHGTRIDVDDSGPGVPEDVRQRVFDDGFTTRPGGTGFGLAYARRVVERSLRGRIWCEMSDLGGARFSIDLPEPASER